jgi:hypothetical protein
MEPSRTPPPRAATLKHRSIQDDTMSRVFDTMAVASDGPITGPHDDAQNPAGINGMRAVDWHAPTSIEQV